MNLRFFAPRTLTTCTAMFGKTTTAHRNFEKNLKIALEDAKRLQEEYLLTRPNTSEALNKKLSAIQKAQKAAAKIEKMPNGATRYYLREIAARTPGFTRGASYVTEHNPTTGIVRSWMENYNHSGEVIRIHPKMLNGRVLESLHLPPTARERLEADTMPQIITPKGSPM